MNTTTTTNSIWFVAFVTAVTAIGGFLFGYDTAVINGANSYLKANMHLSPSQEGFAGASAILGCIPGAMCAGFLSDRFGRKKLLLACAALFAISGLLSAVPRTFEQFLTARFISGLGIGSSSMICPVYIAEIAPEKWRGRLGSLFQLGIVSGIFLTLFINKVVQGMGNEAWNIASGWRWMLGMEAVPAIIFFGLLFLVPESPRWLAQKGREQEARQVLSHVGDAAYAETELTAIKSAISSETGKLSELFSRTYSRPLAIAVLLMACSQFCGINAIMYYSSRIFESAGLARNSAFASSIWIGLINLLFTFLAIFFIDRAGRRPLLLIGTAVQAVALGMVGWMFHSGHHELALLLWVLVFIAAFAMAMGPIPWIICSEIFPGKLRARAMSVATLAIWSSCYLVAQTFPMLNDDPMIGPAATFWIYGAVSLFSFFFVLTMIKETKGKSLEEIESEWKRAAVSTV
ncbi:MAG TPA: sugar porter family MFS transporter [Verrucomicrobiae bacterium]|jgi:SP family arabinose:H+ symporter-like MFS transporter|nr:sugar porter family MFS transporter [Verrucomicrobiae bacterium]